MSMESFTDLSTHKSYISLQNHDTFVKVSILLVISDYNPLAKIWSAQSPSLSTQSSSSLFSPSSSSSPDSLPRTPPPSPVTPLPSIAQNLRSTVQGRVEVTLVGGLVQLVARHLVHVWRTTLSNTDSLLSCNTDNDS
ncbi:hypothetical protein ElyMa_000528600 [Elysia marginata]|uniref:Uncharacterized protein n=1 Tax=Elysia marginata TaxID=1093978 RepID=A0AAV4FXQ0_9GAST|nr:hypothetical protein ElyMa_000528600 [Elysia marginata]